MKDTEYLKNVQKRLGEIDREVRKGNINTKIVDELNSYGYPLNSLKRKYLLEEGKYKDFYREVSQTYDRMMYIKRGILANMLKEEIRSLGVAVCDVIAEGEGRKKITIRIKDPEDEEAVIKIMTQTQLQYAHLIGVTTVNFESCNRSFIDKLREFIFNAKEKLANLFR